MKAENIALVIGGCFLVLLVIALSLAISTLIVLGVWNLVFVPLFGVGSISVGQALLIGLFISLVGSAFRTTVTNNGK